MKYLIPFLCLFITNVFAQEKVIVTYEYQTITDISNIKNSNLKAQLQLINDHKSEFQLITTDKESIYKNITRVNNSQNNNGVSISIAEDSKIIYKNFKTNKSITVEDYNGKTFLVEDLIKKQPWVLERETETFLGYEIKKASYNLNDLLIEAWYSPKLIYKNGPDNFVGLPGLILKLSIKDLTANPTEETLYTAINVTIDNNVKIIPPKGKAISKNEYDTFKKKKYEKFLKNKTESIDRSIKKGFQMKSFFYYILS